MIGKKAKKTEDAIDKFAREARERNGEEEPVQRKEVLIRLPLDILEWVDAEVKKETERQKGNYQRAPSRSGMISAILAKAMNRGR